MKQFIHQQPTIFILLCIACVAALAMIGFSIWWWCNKDEIAKEDPTFYDPPHDYWNWYRDKE